MDDASNRPGNRRDGIPDVSGSHVVGDQPSVSSSESRARFEVVEQKLDQIQNIDKRDNLVIWTKQTLTIVGGSLAFYLVSLDALHQWYGHPYKAPEEAWAMAVGLLCGSLLDHVLGILKRR